MMRIDEQIGAIRGQFPALTRTVAGQPAIFFDGPAGSQVPQRVADAVSRAMLQTNANEGGHFATSVENDALFADAADTLAAFFGAKFSEEIVFGPNMTSLTFRISQALGETWTAGDEIVVSGLEHDANYSPWVQAAERAGVTVRRIPVRADDCTLDLEVYARLLSKRTRLVAVGMASNATGTINPVAKMAAMAHEVGALVYVDAVHYGPHGPFDVEAWGADFVVASAYKFFGPHVGVLWGRKDLLESLPARKVRPAYDRSPDRWMTGTPNFEGIVGAAEGVRYLADLSPPETGDLRTRILASYAEIQRYERSLTEYFLGHLAARGSLRLWGISAPEALEHRVPTFSLTHPRISPKTLAKGLAAAGVFAWSGNHYAVPFTESLGLEAHGTLRIGLLHYNTRAEIDRCFAVLDTLCEAH